MKRFAILFSFLLASLSAEGAELRSFDPEPLRPFEGRTVSSIRVHGLWKTSERAVRWLLGAREGEAFSVDRWIEGIHKLYNTTALYDIETRVTRGPGEAIAIDLSLHDKWTTLPYATFQGGGGSVNLGLGIFDSNLGGYFTYASVGYSTLNGTTGYDLNLYQEWFRDTEDYFGFDLSRIGYPTTAQGQGGETTSNFTYFRQQQQILLGKRVSSELGREIRAFTYLEHYVDTLQGGDAASPGYLNPGDQWRLRPGVILGRSHLTNFLEEGSEISILPILASSYAGLTTSLKRTWVAFNDWNVAAWASGGVMTNTVYTNQFRLGGFDSIRGFSTDRFRGEAFTEGSLELRPRLWSHRFHFFALDWFVLQGALFTDVGAIYDRGQGAGLGLWSAGAGLRLIFVDYSNAILRLDWARTITPSEGTDFSFGIGQFF